MPQACSNQKQRKAFYLRRSSFVDVLFVASPSMSVKSSGSLVVMVLGIEPMGSLHTAVTQTTYLSPTQISTAPAPSLQTDF